MYNYNYQQTQPTKKKAIKRKYPGFFRKNKSLFTSIGFLIFFLLFIFILKDKFPFQKNSSLEKKLKDQSIVEEKLDIEYASADEVAQSIRHDRVQLVDIREANEFNLKHIESSINIPLSQIKEKINLFKKDKKIIIIDRVDSKLGKILTDHLKREGLTVKYLKNGILGFVSAGYELVDYGTPASTQNLIKVKSLSKEQIKAKFISGEVMAFIDVRPQKSFLRDNIAGSLNIPLEEIENKKSSLPIIKLFIYDDDPIRSFRASVKLYDMGIWNAYNSLIEYQSVKKLFLESINERKQFKKSLSS